GGPPLHRLLDQRVPCPRHPPGAAGGGRRAAGRVALAGPVAPGLRVAAAAGLRRRPFPRVARLRLLHALVQAPGARTRAVRPSASVSTAPAAGCRRPTRSSSTTSTCWSATPWSGAASSWPTP